MRDVFFNEAGVRELAGNIKRAWPDFSDKAFLGAILPNMPALGLTERNLLIRDALRDHLPREFNVAVAILQKALGPERPNEGPDAAPGFYVMAVCAYVAEYGRHDPERALDALKEMTKRFSAEFAIRPFLDQHTERTLSRLRVWARDPHPHVRRLASEGSRPRLPWGMRLQKFVKDPRPVLALLEQLKDDPERFVRRSVANNLNDIAKDHPDLAIATLKRWRKSPQAETQWLVKHALRTLLKQGNPEALELLGYPRKVRITISRPAVTPKRIRVGDAVTIQFDVRSTAPDVQHLMIDYVVHHVKANGETRPKVFKLTTRRLKPGERVTIRKIHSFRAIGIRPYYPGEHAIEVQINGRRRGRATFTLSA